MRHKRELYGVKESGRKSTPIRSHNSIITCWYEEGSLASKLVPEAKDLTQARRSDFLLILSTHSLVFEGAEDC